MIHVGNCLNILPTLEAGSVHTCITSPPYFGLRDYGVDGQIGLEPSPSEFVEVMVRVFREVRRVLRDDGTVWLNLGDSYAGNGGQSVQSGALFKGRRRQSENVCISSRVTESHLKAKDLVGIPWRVAFALQADGWYLRQDIIWAKPNPMPESVTDRCTKSHEYLFLLSKSERYSFDSDAIREVATSSWDADNCKAPDGWDTGPGGHGAFHREGRQKGASGNKARKPSSERGCPDNSGSNVCGSVPWEGSTRNKRSVWTVPTMPFKEAHFATFPEALIEPCVLAGAPMGGTVLDPFMGAGTTAVVAQRLGRQYVGCELNPEYADIARRRIAGTTMGLPFGEVA